MMLYVVRTIVLVASVALAFGSHVRSQPLATDCEPVGSNLVNFYVDDMSYPVWYDGQVTVRITQLTRNSIRFTTDHAITGAIVQGLHRQRITGSGTSFHVNLGYDRVQRVIVCFPTLI